VGTTEEHGPHLPLLTDVIVPIEISKRLAETIDAIIAPPIFFGRCPYSMSFPGTISLRPETFIALVEDICKSLSEHGFERILLINGHGGNKDPLVVASLKLNQEIESRVLVINYWEYTSPEISEVLREGFHADRFETSLVLASRPDLVDMSKAVAEMPELPERSWEFILDFFHASLKNVKALTKSGVLGDGTKGTVDFGNRIIDSSVKNIVSALKEMEMFTKKYPDA